MFLLNIWSEYQNLVKKIQAFLLIVCKLNFHVVKNFHDVKCTGVLR